MLLFKIKKNRAFSRDVTSAILVLQASPLRVEPLSYVKAFFCTAADHVSEKALMLDAQKC